MMNTTYPSIQENQRPSAVSNEAHYVRNNLEKSHVLFIGQSVFIKQMYKDHVKKRFDLYKSVWKNETLFSSSISEIINNSAYRAIIDLGKRALPYIFEDLKTSDSHWFYALESITGENPISESNRGILPSMKQDWIQWAIENNIIDED